MPPEASALWAQARRGVHRGHGRNEDPINGHADDSFDAYDNNPSSASSSAYGSFAMRGASFSLRGNSLRRINSSSPSSSTPSSPSPSMPKRRKSAIMRLGEGKEQGESSSFFNSSTSSASSSGRSSNSPSPPPPQMNRSAPSAVSSANWGKSSRSESAWITDETGNSGNGGGNCVNSVASAEGPYQAEKPGGASKKAAWRSAFAVLYATPVRNR